MIVGTHLCIRPLQLSDVHQFKQWGRHKSILYREYDFLEQTESQVKDWYRWKTAHFFSNYYAILQEELAVGYISFRNINPLLKWATLGLVIDPAKINCGIGTEALFLMLDYYFNRLYFRRIVLKVAKYNTRAEHLYRKMGFVPTSTSLMTFPNGDYDGNNPDFYQAEDAFKLILGKTFFYAQRMELTRENFHRIQMSMNKLNDNRNEDDHVL